MSAYVSSRKLILVLIGFLLGGGVLAGGVVAAQWREPMSPAELDAALREATLVKVADIPGEGDLAARGVFIQPTSAGLICLWDAPSATSLARQGGCNPSDDPLGGKKLMASFAYEGGPAVEDVKDARLIGLAALDVTSVEVVMSDGTRRKLTLRKVPASAGEFRVFGHRFNRGELRGGATPTAVVALSEIGAEIDRQATGF
jgi:hypothetical protein